MIFSFNNYEKADTEFWSLLQQKLPKEYHFPDLPFLETLDPTRDAEPSIMDINALTPDEWDKEDSVWISLSAKLPKDYAIPDLTLIKRLCEIY